MRVNLLPRAVQAGMTRRRHVRRWAAALTVSLSALFGAMGVASIRQSEYESLRKQESLVQADLERARVELRTLTASADRLLQQIQRAEAIRSKRAWSRLLGFIGQSLPEGNWLTAVRTDPAGPTGGRTKSVGLPAAAPQSSSPTAPVPVPKAVSMEAPRKLRITGYAPSDVDPNQFATRLKQGGVFREVVIERTQREPVLDGHYFRFEVICEW